MGKIVLIVVAILAVSPCFVTGGGTLLLPAVQRELNREEKVFQEEFAELQSKYHCPDFDTQEYANEFDVRLARINNARHRAYQTRQQPIPGDFFCEGGIEK